VVVTVLIARPAKTTKWGDTPDSQERADEREAMGTVTPAMAIHPKQDPSLMISVQQLLSVEPFFEADIRSQVAGVVRSVSKDIGDPVVRGEMLIGVDVPDLEQDVAQKEAMVTQRLKDVKVARATVKSAEAQEEVAEQVIEQRNADVGTVEATRDYRKIRYERFVGLAKQGGVKQSIVEEEERDFRAAESAVRSAIAAVHKAQADLREKQTAVEIAEADVELKEALVDVARKDVARARAMLEFSRIVAPFDGVVVKRNVDIGTFVQNSSTGFTSPLLSIVRNDIVTLVMKVPDNAAPFVKRNTEAIIQIDELPGVVIKGRVTRYSPSIVNKDRTMQVEVDLYNDTAEKYGQFRARCVSTWMAGLGGHDSLGVAALTAASRASWSRDSKSRTDRFPMMPQVIGKNGAARLMPGMTGYMRLNLRQFRNGYLIPSSAVFTRGGKPYLLEVDKDDITKLVPVRVQINDGRLAKVSIIVEDASPTKGRPELLRELTGDETIILNRQAEIGEGQAVKVTIEENWEHQGKP
jgi:multidrug resistance efflux pump